ncbi:16S rRNA (cytosine967-C5)-methyltransferase [Methylomarinovum tepidoasis]|uniref:16S rRNA (cytosine(967)-C(5))-methyltransferase n=1 Tax=Methylomarinovum tepidoasis TaxID=2840183 RepID=A0AAU9C1E4_9GAMM|nr:16S rRNA (cytosine(967)-C(5))-methyltransferase RsmB [Methylomarinovum sp. IN45]BCX89758.1 16S rRNA (cytosine967-C5)-methyltransferase [Methylomarinovum sp. IN45]
MSRLRRLAADVVRRVEEGQALDEALVAIVPQDLAGRDRAWVQAACYTTVRWYHRLDFILCQLLAKPLKDRRIRALALVGLAQLGHMAVKPHAAVAETVAAAGRRKAWARSLLNAVLRNYLRRRDELETAADADYEAAYSHPAWLRRRIEAAWPEEVLGILQANNRQAPMTLRVNLQRIEPDAYRRQLAQAGLDARPVPGVPSALVLSRPVPVEALPGFAEGWVSVQDAAAQLAASLLDLRPGQRVLDLCAAPGGKSAHMLEICPGLAELVAVDAVAERLEKVRENLRRGRFDTPVTLVCGDARRPRDWWGGRPFDRILIDAPCSATGVIRRHPDIKLLRRDADIAALACTQAEMLAACWPLLRAGGRLVYATCSILPEENAGQLAAFLSAREDARVIPLEADWGRESGPGRQILPGEREMDGFYYACLERCA